MIEIMKSKLNKFAITSILKNPFPLLILKFLLKPICNATIHSSSSFKGVENNEPNSCMQLQNGLEVLRKLVQQNEEEEEKKEREKQLPDDLALYIKTAQFSKAEQKLRNATNITYKYALHEVYNHDIDNFDALLNFGDWISDVWTKYKIYEALRTEMRDNGHDDIEKLRRFYTSVKNQVIDRRTDVINSESLYNCSWNLIREDIPNIIIRSMIIDEPLIHLNYVKSFQDKVDIWKQVLEKVWDKVNRTEICKRARKYQKYLDAQVAFDVALFHQLKRIERITWSGDVIDFLRYTKVTADNSNYHFLSKEIKSRHEQVINELPRSVKKLVFSSAVCFRNIAYDEYLFSPSSNYQLDEKRRHVFTWKPKGIGNPIEFKWTVSFMYENHFKLSNHNGEYLYISEEIPSYKSFIFTNISSGNNRKNNNNDLKSLSYHWGIAIEQYDRVQLGNYGSLFQFLAPDCCERYDANRRKVFLEFPSDSYRTSKAVPNEFDWEVVDCSNI